MLHRSPSLLFSGLVSGVLVLGLSGPSLWADDVTVGPCEASLRSCLKTTDAWFEPCTKQAEKLASPSGSTSQRQRLQALCERPRQVFAQVCATYAAQCNQARVDELNRITESLNHIQGKSS